MESDELGGMLPDELVAFEERQDLSQYSYDANDMMESVNLNVALNDGGSSLPSSQDKLFDPEYCLTECERNSQDYSEDILEMLGLSCDQQQMMTMSRVPDENDDDHEEDNKTETESPTVQSFIGNELHFNFASPGGSTVPDSTTFFTLEGADDFKPSKFAELSDRELLSLPTRELNRRIRHLPLEEQHTIKGRRRTLKNRGYAQTCRTRRVGQRNQLETDNDHLITEVDKLKEDNVLLLAECERLRKEGNRFRNERDNCQSQLQALLNALAQNNITISNETE